MNTEVQEIVNTLERLSERIQESARVERNFQLEISNYLDAISYSCWKHAQELKEAQYYLGSY